MHHLKNLFLVIVCTSQLMACSENEITANEKKRASLTIPWWGFVKPIVINGNEFYGKTCSVTRVINDAGIKSATIIFTVPDRLFTYCSQNDPNKNYLDYDGEYIILHVHRQTVGAGSKTAERYRSADFKSWQEYIGVTWVNGDEYEAWRTLGSKSSKADSRKKVVK